MGGFFMSNPGVSSFITKVQYVCLYSLSVIPGQNISIGIRLKIITL